MKNPIFLILIWLVAAFLVFMIHRGGPTGLEMPLYALGFVLCIRSLAKTIGKLTNARITGTNAAINILFAIFIIGMEYYFIKQM